MLLEDPSPELASLLNFYLFLSSPRTALEVSLLDTDPPSWSLSLATSSVNPIDFLFMSPDEKLQRQPKEKKKGGLCIVK